MISKPPQDLKEILSPQPCDSAQNIPQNTPRPARYTSIMGRMTRAKAAAVAQDMHVDAEAVLELPDENNTLASPDAKPTTPERAVLGEIAPNSTESKAPVEIVTRKTRGRKKAEEEKAEEEERQVEVVEAVDEAVGQDEEEAETEAEAEQHALDATTNETMERLAKLRITSIGNAGAPQATGPTAMDQDETTTNVPEPEEIETTTTALDEPASTMSDEPSAPIATQAPERSSSELPDISIDTKPQPEENEVSEPEVETPFEAPGSPVATAVPKLVKDLRTESPGKRSTSNKENVQPVEHAVPVEPTQTATPSQDVSIVEADTQSTASPSVSTAAQHVSPSQNVPLNTEAAQPTAAPSARRPSSNKSEDPIEAMDELEDAVEKVNLEIPNLTSSAEKRSEKPTEEKEKAKKAKPAPVVRMTKATQARLSMAQGGSKDAVKAPTTTRPRPSTTLGRASSVRQSVVPSAARKDPKTTSTTTKPDSRPKKETVIPHSKPRPVSLSFPTPPPAPKSSKAPTKSTFQLPGEAVAAKLKAAREERMKREAEQAAAKSKEKPDVAAAEKKPAFKARPVPGTLKHTPSVRQTAASRARESAMNGGSSGASVKKGPTSTTGTATAKPRPSTSTSSSKPPAPTNLTVSKRPRPSSVQIPASTSSFNPAHRSTSNTSTSTSKGKEVYARAAAAKEAAETSKREKEDAARKARAAAAERGRAASREWAEKQKARKAGGGKAGAGGAGVAEAAVAVAGEGASAGAEKVVGEGEAAAADAVVA